MGLERVIMANTHGDELVSAPHKKHRKNSKKHAESTLSSHEDHASTPYLDQAVKTVSIHAAESDEQPKGKKKTKKDKSAKDQKPKLASIFKTETLAGGSITSHPVVFTKDSK
jgi:hypothetical protein